MDEIAADFTEALTKVDPARFETLAKENRSVARKLLGRRAGLHPQGQVSVQGQQDRENQAAANAYGVSIDTSRKYPPLGGGAESEPASRRQAKNAAQTDGGTKFSIKRTSQMTLAQQLKMFTTGRWPPAMRSTSSDPRRWRSPALMRCPWGRLSANPPRRSTTSPAAF